VCKKIRIEGVRVKRLKSRSKGSDPNGTYLTFLIEGVRVKRFDQRGSDPFSFFLYFGINWF